jgi:hypothetical protein
MQDDLNRLVVKPPADKRLTPAETPPAIRSKTGIERPPGSRINTSTVTVESTDGLFSFEVTVANG